MLGGVMGGEGDSSREMSNCLTGALLVREGGGQA